ncbi:MAG TPA: AgmX/PglI C-terminal domain-containing protein [Polyangia bacterium]
MRSEQGSIDRDEAEAAIADNWPRLKNCYQEAGSAMTFAEGGVTLRFDVDVSGRTTGVEVIESKLGNFAVETCLGGVARAVRFPRPHGGGRARVEYTLEFRSTDERPVLELPREVTDDVRVGLLAHLHATCGALGANDTEATAYVDRRGHVASAGFGGKTPLAPERAACAANALAQAVVPHSHASDGDALVRLSFGMSDVELDGARAAAAAASKANARSRSKDRLASKGRRRR